MKHTKRMCRVIGRREWQTACDSSTHHRAPGTLPYLQLRTTLPAPADQHHGGYGIHRITREKRNCAPVYSNIAYAHPHQGTFKTHASAVSSVAPSEQTHILLLHERGVGCVSPRPPHLSFLASSVSMPAMLPRAPPVAICCGTAAPPHRLALFFFFFLPAFDDMVVCQDRVPECEHCEGSGVGVRWGVGGGCR